MNREIVPRPAQQPDRIESDIKAVEISVEKIARMDGEEWAAALSDFKEVIDTMTSAKDLGVFERNLQDFLEGQKTEMVQPKFAGAHMIRRVLGAVASLATTIGTSVASMPYGRNTAAAMTAGFAYLIGKDAVTSYKTHKFRLSETGAARMKELSDVLRDVRHRVEEATPMTIQGAPPEEI